MSKAAFESMKAGLVQAVKHQRGQAVGVVVTGRTKTERFDAQRKT